MEAWFNNILRTITGRERITIPMRKESNRIIHTVMDAEVGENQPFSAQLLTQPYPLVPEPGGTACQLVLFSSGTAVGIQSTCKHLTDLIVWGMFPTEMSLNILVSVRQMQFPHQNVSQSGRDWFGVLCGTVFSYDGMKISVPSTNVLEC
jgi:hypothetical protein